MSIYGRCVTAAVFLALGGLLPVPVRTQAVSLVHDQIHSITAKAEVTAVRSGNWSDPLTWGGTLPGERAKVAIPRAVTVTVDREIPMGYDWLRVDGTLRFRPDADTRLVVETLVAMGRLEIGTEAEPIQSGVTARLVFKSPVQPISHAIDPLELTRGLIAMSPVSIYGTPKREISALVGFPDVAATTLMLEQDPVGWRAGDDVLVTPTLWGQDEVVTAVVARGRTIEIAPPLKYTRKNVPTDPAIRVHVGNLTRNVIIQTDPNHAGQRLLQGHVMLMGGGHRIYNAAFLDTGRTVMRGPVTRLDGTTRVQPMPVTDPILLPDGTRDAQLMPICEVTAENVRGRYALHFHNPSAASEPSLIEGVVVRVQRERGFKVGIQNHSAHVYVRRSIVHQIDGAGLMSEEGDERGEFTGNLVVHSQGSGSPIPLPKETCPKNEYREIHERRRDDWGHHGSALWLEHSGNVVVKGNIFVGQDGGGVLSSSRPLHFRKKNTFAVLVRPDHLRDGYAWVGARRGAIDPAKPSLDISLPPLEVSDNQFYAIRNAALGLETGLGMEEWQQRPRNLFARNLAWNVGRCMDFNYSSWGRIEDTICIAGLLSPGSRLSTRRGVDTAHQRGSYWQYHNLRIEGFTAGQEFQASQGSTFTNVTVNGQPYVPVIEACGDNVDNDNDGQTDEGCPAPLGTLSTTRRQRR